MVLTTKLKANEMTIINLNATVKTADDVDHVWGLRVEREDLIACMTPDGPSDDFSCSIHLTNWYTGQVYVLNSLIIGKIISEDFEDEETGYCETVTYYKNSFSTASDLVEKMKAKGVINLDHWVHVKEENKAA